MSEEGHHGAAVIPEAKQQQVTQLAEKLGRMRSAVLSDYRGLTVAQLEELRGSLRAAGVDYLVLKNTLARRAGEQAGLSELIPQLVGPTAIAISYQDISAPARLLIDYARATRRPEMVRGGIAEGQILNQAEVRQLADLPSREVLIAQLLGVMEAAATQLVGLLEAPGRDLVGLLDAQTQALGGAAAA
ncbi:MAG: 50S ribosomal protein L10 [Candidatus Dormibacteria bacterium]